MRKEEQWAATVISKALGVDVVVHDDGTENGMYDLDICYSDARVGAVEVTTVTDPEVTALWKLINTSKDVWRESSLVGGWLISLWPAARAKRLKSDLAAFLADLESRGVTAFSGDGDWRYPREAEAGRLGIARGEQGPSSRPGSIYFIVELPPEQSGGAVPNTGDLVAHWVGEWVRDPARQDNLSKLHASGVAERHLAIVLRGFSGVPFGVEAILMADPTPVPAIPPDLPEAMTDLWIWSGWCAGDALRWSRSGGWSVASKC